MLKAFSRSWRFARMSYRLLGEHKRLVIFPMVSTVAAVLVVASFALLGGSLPGLITVIALAVVLVMLVSAVTTAAAAIFSAYLCACATGRTMPASIDTAQFDEAFRQAR